MRWRSEWDGRPLWMNGLLLFCLYMALVYAPFDLFWKPLAEDQEVWLGFALHGWAAKLTAPLHWAIYAAGAYGFWAMRSWMWPWAGIYVVQIAVGMLVWNLRDPRGLGLPGGLASLALFGIPAVALLRPSTRKLFARGRRAS
ncbi:MAG: hypothetical protein ACE5FG_05435 [Myxococcota bacterium]